MEEKRAIRKQVFALRKSCSDENIEKWSREITRRVTELVEFQEAGRILVYADYNHEVMTRFLTEEAWKAGKAVAVPKVEGKDMFFYRLTDFGQLKPGYFGIPEPEEGEIVSWEDALMIMPGVAFDRSGHRVGYGADFTTGSWRSIRESEEWPWPLIFRYSRQYRQSLRTYPRK